MGFRSESGLCNGAVVTKPNAVRWLREEVDRFFEGCAATGIGFHQDLMKTSINFL